VPDKDFLNEKKGTTLLMPRPLRIEYPGALYHITARRNRKDDIFLRDSDRYQFFEILDQSFGVFFVMQIRQLSTLPQTEWLVI
jgi:hypothetical protein